MFAFTPNIIMKHDRTLCYYPSTSIAIISHHARYSIVIKYYIIPSDPRRVRRRVATESLSAVNTTRYNVMTRRSPTRARSAARRLPGRDTEVVKDRYTSGATVAIVRAISAGDAVFHRPVGTIPATVFLVPTVIIIITNLIIISYILYTGIVRRYDIFFWGGDEGGRPHGVRRKKSTREQRLRTRESDQIMDRFIRTIPGARHGSRPSETSY